MTRRQSRAQALEQEWRAFGESMDAAVASFEVTGQQPVICLRDREPVAAGPDTGISETDISPYLPRRPAAISSRLAAAQQEEVAARLTVSPGEVRRLAVEFRRAAVSLAVDEHDAGQAGALGNRAGRALVALADADAEQVLADILRPDPTGADATWTVACYQIGDLSPSSLRDFSSAADAVRCASDCGTPAHVAAELIVTNGDGVRWTALVRSGSSVSFQLLTARTAGSAPGDTGTALRAARHRWEDRMLNWAANPEAGVDRRFPAGPAPEAAAAPEPNAHREPVPSPPSHPPLAPQPTPAPLAGGADLQVQGRLAALERHSVVTATELIELRGELRMLCDANHEYRRDVKRLRRRVDGLEAETSRLRQELSVASQRATVAEIGLATLTSTVAGAPPVTPAFTAARSAAVVSVPAPSRIPAGREVGSRRTLLRIRTWCDRRLAQTSAPDRW